MLNPAIKRISLQSWFRYHRALAPTIVATSLLLVACAGTPPEGSLSEADMECTMVQVTGSKMPVRDCRPRRLTADIEEQDREAALNSVRDIQLLDEAGPQALGADSLGF